MEQLRDQKICSLTLSVPKKTFNIEMPTIYINDLAVKDPVRIIQEHSAWSYRITTAQGWNEDGKERKSCAEVERLQWQARVTLMARVSMR